MSEIITLILKEMPILQEQQKKMAQELAEMSNLIHGYQKLVQQQTQQIQDLETLNKKLKKELSETPSLNLSQEQLEEFQKGVQRQLSTLSLNSLIETEAKTAIAKELQPILASLNKLLDEQSEYEDESSLSWKIRQIEQKMDSLHKLIQSQVA